MDAETVGYTVGGVAKLAGVTVRTLHHYDRIGLLSPSERTPGGYRTYSDDDLERLRSILVYRALGFPLQEIAALLDEPDRDATAHLRRQHGLLEERAERLSLMIAAVEKEMEARQMGIDLTPEERFEVWGDLDPEVHADEAERRWGDTEAYRESSKRTSTYTKDDWLKIKDEAGSINRRLVEALKAGTPAEASSTMDLAEEHRQHIGRWFYPCSPQMHRGLGDMYVADPRFKATYEEMAEGLAGYLRDAIVANAQRAGS